MKRVLKTVVAIALVTVLLFKVDWMEARVVAGRLTPDALAGVLLFMIGELALSTWKWSRALRMHDLVFPYLYLFRSVCIGYFLNNFLPTSIGGDTYRVFRTLPASGHRSRAVAAILVDRAAGIAMLMTLGAAGAVWLWQDAKVARYYLLIYAIGVVSGIAVLAAWQFAGLGARVQRLRSNAFFDAIAHNTERWRHAGSAWLQQVGLSLLFQVVSVTLVFWMFHESGTPVSFAMCALITASAGFAALMPLSINGIGLMEGSFVAVSVGLGIGYEQALLVAVVRRLMMVVLSLLCAGVYLVEGRQALAAGSEPPK